MSDPPVRIATGPVSWGVDFADVPDNPRWEWVLDQIARAGYSVTELGPLGYLPEERGRLRTELARRNLTVAGSFLFEPLHDQDALQAVLLAARKTCSMIAGAGGRFLVVIDEVSPRRAATAGRSEAAERLDATAHRRLVDAVRRIATVAAEEFGLRAVLHNHAGTYLEFEDELDGMLAAVEPDLLGLCVDSGHAAYAGIDPTALVELHGKRVAYLHLKDVAPEVLADVRERRLDFWSAISAGIFCPLGRGMVDFAGLAAALRRLGFDGWATVEQDRDPGAGDPTADVIASREYLERVGMAKVRETTG